MYTSLLHDKQRRNLVIVVTIHGFGGLGPIAMANIITTGLATSTV